MGLVPVTAARQLAGVMVGCRACCPEPLQGLPVPELIAVEGQQQQEGGVTIVEDQGYAHCFDLDCIHWLDLFLSECAPSWDIFGLSDSCQIRSQRSN